MTPAITYAIPFYRKTDLLRAAIESVRSQSRDDWELLVCDDSGIELGVEALVRGFGDERIDYARNRENLGMVETWNRCIAQARTDLVTLLHADDLLLPHYGETMVSLANAHREASAFFCETEIIDLEGQPKFSMADWVKGFLLPETKSDLIVLHGEGAVADLMAGYFIMTPTLCYRKSKLLEQRFDPSWRQVQDLVFIVGLLMDGHTIVGARECAYAYRRHEHSATHLQSDSMLRFDEEVEAFDRIAARAEALGWVHAAEVSRRKRIIRLHLLYRALRELTRLHPGRSLEALRYSFRLG